MRRAVLPLLWICLMLPDAAAQSDVTVDRKAVAQLLAAKNPDPGAVGFDFAHLDSMPLNFWAAYAGTRPALGHLAVYRRIQREPLSFPEEISALVDRFAAGEVLTAMGEAIDKPVPVGSVPPPAELRGLPKELAQPIGGIVAAIAQKDLARIVAAIDAARPALLSFISPIEWEQDGIVVTRERKPTTPGAVLWIKFGGDDRYEGAWAQGSAQHPVGVVIDVGGNDTYDAGSESAALGGGNGGIGVLVDLAGNDAYTGKGQILMGSGYQGSGVLIDQAGNDRYVAETFSQGAAQDGIGLLWDRAGNDTYEIAGLGQGYARPGGFGLVLDVDGDDDYLARDPLYGHPVTMASPQDPAHNASMAQGAGTGSNQEPLRAGGVGMLVDLKGDDRYRAGCWAQGVGYFLGIGALVDRAGFDEYQSWVYVMGSGAHGGQGICMDDCGNDVYQIGGWNCLGMAVDYAIGMFLDGHGNDRYIGSQTGLGSSLGLGIALFQDGGGDDVYAPKDGNFGFGNHYEREDYNQNGTVDSAEARHWGLFLDLGGSDRYTGERANGQRWDSGPCAGGKDWVAPPPIFAAGRARTWDGAEVDVTDQNWQQLRPDDLLRLLPGSPEDRALFALEHGLWREAGPLLVGVADAQALLVRHRGPGVYAWDAACGLWLAPDEAVWSTTLAPLAWKSPAEAAAFRPDPQWPRWVQREATARAQALLAEHERELRSRLARWHARKDVIELLAKKKELNQLRAAALTAAAGEDRAAAAEAERALALVWAARRKTSVKNDLKPVAAQLDVIQPDWRAIDPWAGFNSDLDPLTLENVALDAGERTVLATVAPDLAGVSGTAKAAVAAVNEFRAMLGRAPVAPEPTLMKFAAACVRAGKAQGQPEGFAGKNLARLVKGRSPVELIAACHQTAADHQSLVDVQWQWIGVAQGGGNWVLVFGSK